MPKANAEIEVQITKALASLSEQSKPNLSKTAREFSVPSSRLSRRWKGGKSLFQRQPNGRKLNAAQESALCQFIEEAGASISQSQIATAANSILAEAHADAETEPPKIGEHWIGRFLKRYPQYDQRPEVSDKDHFARFQQTLEKFVKDAETHARLAHELQREFDQLKARMNARND